MCFKYIAIMISKEGIKEILQSIIDKVYSVPYIITLGSMVRNL